MNAEIVQSEKAKAIIINYEEQLAGKGVHYGNHSFDLFIQGYAEETAIVAGLPLDEVNAEIKKSIEKYKDKLVTGKENPIYFTEACYIALRVIPGFKGIGLTVPHKISLGMVERHESNCLAFPSMSPPLLIFTSGLFDLVGDLAFFCSNPLLRLTEDSIELRGALESGEETLLKDIIVYHCGTLRLFTAHDGNPALTHNSIDEGPTLIAKTYSKAHKKYFWELVKSGRTILKTFLVAHELTHLSKESKGDKRLFTTEEEELFCDKCAIELTIPKIINFSLNHKDPSILLAAKLTLPLLFFKLISFIEMGKIAVQEEVDILSVSRIDSNGGYPSIQKRISSAENVLFDILSNSYGYELCKFTKRMWQAMSRQMEQGFESVATNINDRLKPGIDINKLAELAKKSKASSGVDSNR